MDRPIYVGGFVQLEDEPRPARVIESQEHWERLPKVRLDPYIYQALRETPPESLGSRLNLIRQAALILNAKYVRQRAEWAVLHPKLTREQLAAER